MLEVPRGQLYIGGALDPTSGERTRDLVTLDADRLTTHGVIVGMTGSGKTGLGIVLLEEALLAGVPTLILDPKGDMGNLLLRFPSLAAADFRPWIDETAARRSGTDPDAYAEKVALEWKQGLADWQIDSERMTALGRSAELSIYTPGSSSGTPLALLGSPVSSGGHDLEAVRDEIEAYVSGLLALADIEADPLSSPEHVLLATLLENAWRQNRTLDLAGLVMELVDPPIRKLGVFDVDRFFPKKERNKLATRLNALLASPSFAAWLEGDPLDVGALFFSKAGRPRGSILYLQHLSDAERMLVVTLVLSKVATWMRSQPGSSGLRALVYMDEVFGYAPPTAAPPSKKPVLTLLKQARAFGVGLVLATQNPVDLDYKALSNAGTWLIGRLQTDRDRARMVEGLGSALGIDDVGELEKLIGGLDKRQYVLHQVGQTPRTFASRWAMSYLRGPLTKDELRRLRAQAPAPAPARPPPMPVPVPAEARPIPVPVPAQAQPVPVPVPVATQAPVPVPAAPTPAYAPAPYPYPHAQYYPAQAYYPQHYPAYVAPASPAPYTPGTTQPMAAQPIPVAQSSPPPVAPGLSVRYAANNTPWLPAVGAAQGGGRLAPALIATVELEFDEKKLDLHHVEQYEAVLFPLGPSFETSRISAVDHDPRDFQDNPPPGRPYLDSPAPLGDVTWLERTKAALLDHLRASRQLEVYKNTTLKLCSRAGEDRHGFELRCQYEADQRADADAEKLRDRYASRFERLRDAIQKAAISAQDFRADARARQQQSYVSGIAGLFMGGRSGVRGLAGIAKQHAGAQRVEQRAVAAEGRARDKQAELIELERDLATEIDAIAGKWARAAADITPLKVALDKSDVRLSQLFLAWLPVY